MLLLSRAGISGFEVNFEVRVSGERFVIDIAFPDIRLAIEIDSRRYHGLPVDRARDELKDRLLRNDGWEVVRIEVVQLFRDPAAVLARVRGALSRAGSGGGALM